MSEKKFIITVISIVLLGLFVGQVPNILRGIDQANENHLY